MSDTLLTLAIVGVVGLIAYSKRCEWFQICGDLSSAIGGTGTSTSSTSSNTSSGSCLGPANFGDEGPDKGFGFSKDGGPVNANGLTDSGEPRVGDNSNRNSLTICQLPGNCETKLYKGKIQYRHNGLSASADTCDHAKQYFLYKYGLGVTTVINNINPPAHSTGKKKRKTTSSSKKHHSHYTRVSYF